MEKIERLKTCLRSNRIWYDKTKIEIVYSDQEGMHIKSINDIHGEEVLVKIPKTAILSTQTTAISNLLLGPFEKTLLGLIIAIWYESEVTKDSPWQGYLSSLPVCVDVPLLWDSSEVDKLLYGTDIWSLLNHTRKILKNQYENDVIPFLEEHKLEFGQKSLTYNRFLEFYTIVESRSFEVDIYHNLSMCPLADVFNHSDRENVHFQTDDKVCEICGELWGCEHDDEYDEDERISLEESIPELFDSFRGPSESPNPHDQPSPNENDLDWILPREDTCDIIAFDDIPSGTQCYNTYGDLPNHTLLLRYGIIIEGNPHDVVFVDVIVKKLWGGKSGYHEIMEKLRNAMKEGFLSGNDTEKDDISESSDSIVDEIPDDIDQLFTSLLPIMVINADGEVSSELFSIFLYLITEDISKTDQCVIFDAMIEESDAPIPNDFVNILYEVYDLILRVIIDRLVLISDKSSSREIVSTYITCVKRILECAQEIYKHRQSLLRKVKKRKKQIAR